MTDILRLAVTPEILSWPSTSVKILGSPFKGIQGIKFEEKRERKQVYGMSRDGVPVGQTSGKYTPGPLNLKMLADSFKVLTALLAASNPLTLGSYGDVKFPIVVKYEEPLDPTGITIVTFTTCTVQGVADDLSEGGDENMVDVTLGCMGVTRNGLTLYSRVRGLSL